MRRTARSARVSRLSVSYDYDKANHFRYLVRTAIPFVKYIFFVSDTKKRTLSMKNVLQIVSSLQIISPGLELNF